MPLREKILMGWVAILTVLFAAQAFGPMAKSADAAYRDLTVERLNVVEPDGTLRLVISNAPRYPELWMDGKEYPHPGRDRGGMLFFNLEGDEVGGLSFNGGRTADGHKAGAQLAFDQFKQDQTVAIQYQDDSGKRSAGLRVWDRPEWEIKQLVEMHAAVADKSEAEIKAAREKMMAFAKEHGMPAERAFVGKVPDGSSVVKLSDPQGRVRLLLAVDADGNPSLKFLDEQGGVVSQLPQRN